MVNPLLGHDPAAPHSGERNLAVERKLKNRNEIHNRHAVFSHAKHLPESSFAPHSAHGICASQLVCLCLISKTLPEGGGGGEDDSAGRQQCQ